MSDLLITITAAHPSWLEEVLALLQVVHLPSEGVAESLSNFLVAKTAHGKIVGCVGLEPHGKIGLLRSAAVHPDYQGGKLGTRLVSALLHQAAQANLKEVVLLTTTAQDFFAQTFHFQPVQRWKYAKKLQHSPEWKLPRCSAAVCMKLTLEKKKDTLP